MRKKIENIKIKNNLELIRNILQKAVLRKIEHFWHINPLTTGMAHFCTICFSTL